MINFPTRNLKEVELEAEGGESDGGGSESNNNLSVASKIINHFLPASVPQPIGIYKRGAPYSSGIHYIYDVKEFATKIDSEATKIDRWTDVNFVPPKNIMLLYPSGTVLTNGMLLSIIEYDVEYPVHINGIDFYNDNEDYGLMDNYTIEEITLNGNVYTAVYSNY